MLHRSTSSRRRRASRSTASSPSQARTPRSAATSPGRRASIAVSPVDGTRGLLQPDINRSPRHSIIPDISLDENNSEISVLTDYNPEIVLSPRNSLVPDVTRSPRHSLVPDYSRSPRNSLIPDSALSPRNSLVPNENYNRSPRNSLVPDSGRSPRNSLVPDNTLYGSRISLSPDFNRSPRNSLVPDSTRSPRQSLTPLTPPESTIWNQNGLSPQEEPKIDPPRSPRHSIALPGDPIRSPRGSVAPETLNVRTSPRGSIGSDYHGDRSPRGSIGPDNNNSTNRSPRGSLARNTLVAEESGRSPRGSLTLTFQEPPVSERRSSTDNPSGSRAVVAGRTSSPYRSGSRGAINMGYSGTAGLSEGGSRRASSSVSQVSGDEQKRLCAEQKYDGEQGLGLGISLTTYGSVAYQLKDANLEATSTCDFVLKAMNIVNKTIVVTVVLICLSALPLLMMIMGIQFLRDCPREPHIPVYMVVGGSVGCVKMAWLLWNQLRVRRIDTANGGRPSVGARVAALALTLFLAAWFALGNYWVLSIRWPDYAPTLFEPNRWCHRTLYVFALVHLGVVYALLAVVVLLVALLAACQLAGCPLLGPARYK